MVRYSSILLYSHTFNVNIRRVHSSVYISGRPFVLRDASEPRRTLKMSDRAENLEAIELRLKNDILAEAQKYVRMHCLVDDSNLR